LAAARLAELTKSKRRRELMGANMRVRSRPRRQRWKWMVQIKMGGAACQRRVQRKRRRL
jgi:hypothetical protein